MRRRLTFILCALDLLAWAIGTIAAADELAGTVLTILILMTALPGFLLACARRAPDLALAFALGFPGAYALFLVLTMLALP